VAKTKQDLALGSRHRLSKLLTNDPFIVALTRGEWEKLNGFHDGRYEK
jgi:hypothetical protein